MIEKAKEIGFQVGNKVSPILEYISQKVAGFIDVAPENVHLLILGGISMYLANLISGRDGFGIKFWGIAIGLWFLFKYLGF